MLFVSIMRMGEATMTIKSHLLIKYFISEVLQIGKEKQVI